MWIRFETKKQFAIKIYVGGVNAISAEPAVENFATKLRCQTLNSQPTSLQDYIVTLQQLWLDGITVSPGKVRQFVSVPSAKGFSVEAQITNAETVGGVQFEITRRKYEFNKTIHIASKNRKEKLSVLVDLEMTVGEFKELVEERTNISVDNQRYLFNGSVLFDGKFKRCSSF